jgi:hypothetical protein
MAYKVVFLSGDEEVVPNAHHVVHDEHFVSFSGVDAHGNTVVMAKYRTGDVASVHLAD